MKTNLARFGAAAVAVAAMAAPAVSQEEQRVGVLTRYDPHQWTLRATINVRAHTEYDPKTGHPKREAFDFTSAAVVFPLIDRTASSVAKPPPASTGRLMLNDREADTEPDLLTDYPAGTRLGKWTLRDWTGQEVSLQVNIVTTTYKTRLDEAAAAKLGWPQSWPPIAQSTFTPQAFVEIMPGQDPKAAQEDMKIIADLVKKWTNGKDPKSIPPLHLAKYLCGEVIRLVQISGDGLNYGRTGEVEGLNLQGAAETARRGRGTEFDMAGLLAAVYRTAGLPARTVIGYDVGGTKRDHFLDRPGSGKLRAWVEFALADPQAPGGITWVPVDVVRMRRSSSRPPSSLDKPWPYFGTHDGLDGMIPFAFQFHPPTTVVAHGSSAFWGWMVTPAPPQGAEQVIRFDAITTPKTAESQREERERRRGNDREGRRPRR